MSLAVFLILFVLGCGYQIKKDLPFEFISIGNVENKTFEPKIQDNLKAFIAQAFLEYGFKLDSSARYKIESEIVRFDVIPIAESNLSATLYQINIKARFKIINQQTNKVFSFDETEAPFTNTTFGSTSSLQDLLTQREIAISNALKNLSQDIVRKIIYKKDLMQSL